MKIIQYAFICLLALNGLALQPALADKGLQMDDVASVDEAVERIKAILEDQGFDIPLVVNHAAAAQSVNLELRPTQVIYARPNRFIEHFLLKRSDTIGIDLPKKILVYENDEGFVKVLFNPIGYLVDRHKLALRDPLLKALQFKSEQFSDFPSGLITLPSKLTFEETVESLKSAIPSPPFRIPLELDYADGKRRDLGASKKYGRRPPFLLVFGNPAAGTPLMQTDQRIGLDLPQEFLVWEDRDGGVNITWNDPFFIAGRYDLTGQDDRLELIANALRSFAQTGAGN